MYALDSLLIYLWVYYKGYFIFIYICCRLIIGLAYRKLGVDKWYLGFIPIANLACKYDYSGLRHIVVLIVQGMLTVLAFANYSVALGIIALGISVYTNKCFSENILAYEHPMLFATVPCFPVFYMGKELLKHEDTETR